MLPRYLATVKIVLTLSRSGARLAPVATRPKTPTPDDRYHHGDLREALIDAGEAELAERGIEGFSLRGVARRAGVSHAAPAHHFRDAAGLLTALATEGFRRFLQRQLQRQKKAAPDPVSQLVASGMGYIDFALAHPALFRLMFASGRPAHGSPELAQHANAAYNQLEHDVARLTSPAPAMQDVAAVWALTHGFADLLVAGRMKALVDMRKPQREAALAAMLRSSFEAMAARRSRKPSAP